MSRNVLYVSLAVTIATSFAISRSINAKAQEAQSNTRQSTNQNSQNQANQNNNRNQSNDQSTGGQTTAGNRQGQQQGQWKNPDHCFATCIALANQEEVALAEIASQKAENEEVKKFAEMMQHDHQGYLTKLQRFAPEAARQGYLGTAATDGTRSSSKSTNQSDKSANRNDRDADRATSDRDAKDQNTIRQTAGENDPNNQSRSQTAAGSRSDSSQGPMNMLQIEREIAQQCLTSAKQKLNQKSGAEFDKCYIGQQIAKHEAMKDKLTVFQRHASSELRQVLADGLKTTEHHLAKAEEIMKTLDHGSSSTSKTLTTRDRENK